MAQITNSVEEESDFGSMLRFLMKRPTYVVTPGWLSKLSGIPKASLVNWLEGRVSRPRSDAAIPALCEALRLTSEEMYKLYEAAGSPRPRPRPRSSELDNVPVGLYRTTMEGRILYANMTLVKMLGYAERREYQDLDVSRDLYARPEQRANWIANIEKAGTLLRQPVWAKRVDGSELLLLDSATAVRDERGAVLYYEGVWEYARLPSHDD